jgi:hypothetical protein
MSARRLPAWIVVFACTVAAIAAAFGQRVAEAQQAEPIVHGLHPMPDDREVPPKWLPPGHVDPDRGPSPVIFPPQRITIRFNHHKHATEAGATCLTCHFAAKSSTTSDDSLIPHGTTCDACHDSDHRDLSNVKAGAGPMGQCSFCHLGWRPEDGSRVAPIEIPRPNMRFNHKAHLDRNIECAQCHGEVAELELATRDQLPRMNGCLGCHQMPEPSAGGAKSECTTCHLTSTDGHVRTMFAAGELQPPRWLHDAQHGPDWIERHRQVAADDSAFCSTCHAEDFCTSCHDGKIRPRTVHPNDWISMHPIAAREDNPRCTSCHQEQSFCLSCHQRLGIVMSGPNLAEGHRFHPPGWADLRNRTPGHHAWEAERNLNACVSCHTERDCAMCHASTGRQGLGVNPHGAGFVSSCAAALRRNARPCLVCHDPGSPELGQCR